MKKFFILALTLLAGCLAITSCKKDKVKDPEPEISKPADNGITISPEDWHDVPQSGCTLELGDISLTVPSNTFSGDTKLSVTKLKGGSYYGTYEASGFYYITVPPKVNQSISVKLTPSKKGTKVQYTALAPFHRKSSDEDITGGIDLDCSYDNGECTVKLPTSTNDDGGSNLWIIVGLVEDKSNSSSGGAAIRKMTDLTETPAGQVKNVKWHYTVDTWWWLTRSEAEMTKMNKLTDSLTLVITDAITKIHDLGFVLDEERNIPICFIREPKKLDNFGNFDQSFWSDSKSTVELNLSALEKSDDPKVWGRTCIHEILHYFQADYDKRSPQVKKFGGEEDVLNEAAAVWVEQFMNDGQLDATFVAGHIPDFLRGYYTFDTKAKYSEQGYGMSSMLYYLTNPSLRKPVVEDGINKNSIVELFQLWKNNPEYRGTSYLTLTKWFTSHNSFFTEYEYDKFLLAVLTGKVFDLAKSGKGDISGFDGSGNVYSFNCDRSHTYPTRTCLGLGCAIDLGNVKDRTSFAGKEIIIKQEKPNVKTYLIVDDDQCRYECYKTPATSDNPLVIKGEEIDKLIPGAHLTDLYFVTINTYGAKKDFAVSCTVQDQKEKVTLPDVSKICGVDFFSDVDMGTADNHSSLIFNRSFDKRNSYHDDIITVNETTNGFTITAIREESWCNESLYVEVNTKGSTPIVTKVTITSDNADNTESPSNISMTLTNIPWSEENNNTHTWKQFSADTREGTFHWSSFSYNGFAGSYNSICPGRTSTATVDIVYNE